MIEEIVMKIRKDEDETRYCKCACSCSEKTVASGRKKAFDYSVKNNVCACSCPSPVGKMNMKDARDSDMGMEVTREVMEEMELVIDDDGEAKIIKQ